MTESPKPTGSAPESAPAKAAATLESSSEKLKGAVKSGPRGRRRRGQDPMPDPGATDADSVIIRARTLLERLILTAGYGWRDIDRMIHKNRGFTAHLLSKREGFPLNELLAILDAIEVRYEDFFAALFPRFDKARSAKPVGAGTLDLLGDREVPELPAEAEREEQAHAIWNRLDRINAMIDQRVLDLMERALGQGTKLPPRPAERAPEAAEPEAASGGSGTSVGES